MTGMAHCRSMLCATILRNQGAPAIAALRVAALLALLAFPAAGRARTFELHADSLQSPLAQVKGLHVQLSVPDPAVAGLLRIDADVLVAPDYGYTFRNVHWDCPLTRDLQGGWRCEGDVRSGNANPMRLSLAIAPTTTIARLSGGRSTVGLLRYTATPDATRLVFEQVPVAWLGAFSATLWAEGRLQKGSLDGHLDIHVPAHGAVSVQGLLQWRGVALDTPDGRIAADALDADVQFGFSKIAAQRRIGVDITFHGGDLLAGSLFATLPKTPVAAYLGAIRSGEDDWMLQTLRLDDGTSLTAKGNARYSPTLGLRAMDLQLHSSDLGVARGRYLTGWLSPAGLADLQLRGGVQVDLAMDANGWRDVHARLLGVDAIDGKQRFAMHAIQGDLRWTASSQTAISDVSWNSAALFGIALGPARFGLNSQSRKLQLVGAAVVPLLGGNLRLDTFDLTASTAATGMRLVIGLTLQKLQVAQLAKVFGWPAFNGTLDGTLPAARYENEILSFDGGLSAQVFGGTLQIARLAMERPFGADPSLNADVTIKGFDLKALTSVFGFGEITGRLDGRISALRLLDWSPIAFDAELHSDDAAPDRRRISQRAITDLSNVGGGGLVGGLQSQALRLFHDFGYERLGLACKLANNICQMDGVGSAGTGYTIVEGSGLPHISVIGFERQVDWPTLVARLQAASHGTVIIK